MRRKEPLSARQRERIKQGGQRGRRGQARRIRQDFLLVPQEVCTVLNAAHASREEGWPAFVRATTVRTVLGVDFSPPNIPRTIGEYPLPPALTQLLELTDRLIADQGRQSPGARETFLDDMTARIATTTQTLAETDFSVPFKDIESRDRAWTAAQWAVHFRGVSALLMATL